MKKLNITPLECLLGCIIAVISACIIGSFVRKDDSHCLATSGTVHKTADSNNYQDSRGVSNLTVIEDSRHMVAYTANSASSEPNITTEVTVPRPNESGFELPLPPAPVKHENLGVNAKDSEVLCSNLRSAITDGRGMAISKLRLSLLKKGSSAVADVSGLLNCGDAPVEIEALRLLVQIGDVEALSLALGKLVTIPRDSDSYGLFLSVFAENHSNAVANWVARTLGETSSADTRERMLDLIYAMKGPAAVAALEGSALNPADDMHEQDAVDGIAIRHDPADTDSLVALLESEKEGISEAAAYGLANVGSADACLAIADKIEATGHERYAHALASVSSSYGQETLLAMATSSETPDVVRVPAIQALSRHSSDRVKAVLANVIEHEQNEIVISEIQTALQTIDSNVNGGNDQPIPNDGSGETCF